MGVDLTTDTYEFIKKLKGPFEFIFLIAISKAKGIDIIKLTIVIPSVTGIPESEALKASIINSVFSFIFLSF